MIDEEHRPAAGPVAEPPPPTPPGDAGGEASAPADAPEPVARPPIPWLRVVPGCLLAWAFPGLGHVVLGRVRRGLGFALVILGLFVGGIALQGKVYRPVAGEPLSYLAATGAAGVGVPFVVAQLSGMAEGRLTSAYHDYGNTFTLVAGLLNLLVVIDAYDVALGRR